MLIELYTTEEDVKIYWDTEKEQSQQDELAVIFVSNYSDITNPSTQRKEVEVWNPNNYRITEANYVFKDIYNIQKSITYLNEITSNSNGLINTITYSMSDIPQVWHEESCIYQIVMTLEDNVKLLTLYDVFAKYCNEHGIVPHTDFRNLYIYVNSILPEHQWMFNDAMEKLGIIITINEKEI